MNMLRSISTWANVGAFAGSLFVLLNAVSVVTIFGFDHYEGKLGSRWDNLLLDVIVHSALTLVCALGYFSALLVASRARVLSGLRRPVCAAALAAALAFAVILTPEPFPDAPTEATIALAGIYWFCIGVAVAFVNWWPPPRGAHVA